MLKWVKRVCSKLFFIFTLQLDISVLEGTTGNPAFIEDLVVTGTTATLSYQLFYSTDPCAGASLFKIEIDAQTVSSVI